MGYNLDDIQENNRRSEIKSNAEIGRKVSEMRAHPSYLLPTPTEGESQIAFALRCASHIVSPPQFEGESYDVECTTVRDGILSLLDEVTQRWNEGIAIVEPAKIAEI